MVGRWQVPFWDGLYHDHSTGVWLRWGVSGSCCRGAIFQKQWIWAWNPKQPYVHPWRLTWNIIMEVWKIIFLSQWVIYRFHVNLPGCKWLFQLDGEPNLLHRSHGWKSPNYPFGVPGGGYDERLTTHRINSVTVDGRYPANQLICSLSRYLQGLYILYTRWCRISSTNSIMWTWVVVWVCTRF